MSSFLGIAQTAQQKPVYRIKDWGEPVPQRTLTQLGLPEKFAKDPQHWEMVEQGMVRISPDSFPFTFAMVGAQDGGGYTAQQLWEATPAFREAYATPVAMLWALLKG